jgi:hypothetical protein
LSSLMCPLAINAKRSLTQNSLAFPEHRALFAISVAK